MKKAQVSVEYLLLLGTVVTMLVLVLLVSNRIFNYPTEQIPIEKDKLSCSFGGERIITDSKGRGQLVDVKVTLEGYFDAYDGTLNTAPRKIIWGNKEYTYNSNVTTYPVLASDREVLICQLQEKYTLNYSFDSNLNRSFYLEGNGGDWFEYAPSSTSGPGPAFFYQDADYARYYIAGTVQTADWWRSWDDFFELGNLSFYNLDPGILRADVTAAYICAEPMTVGDNNDYLKNETTDPISTGSYTCTPDSCYSNASATCCCIGFDVTSLPVNATGHVNGDFEKIEWKRDDIGGFGSEYQNGSATGRNVIPYLSIAYTP